MTDTEKDPDVSTPQAVLDFCAAKRREMADVFALNGRFETREGFSFMGYVFATHLPAGDPPVPEKLPAPVAYRCALPRYMRAILSAHHHTEFFSQAFKQMAKESRATGSLLMAEQWTTIVELDPAKVDPNDKDAVRAALFAERDKLPDSLEDAPGRSEGLLMVLEHIDLGRLTWLAQIHRNPTRLGEWEERKWDDAEGRFIGVVNKL